MNPSPSPPAAAAAGAAGSTRRSALRGPVPPGFLAGFATATLVGWMLQAASVPPSVETEPDPIPPFPRQELTRLWRIAEWQDEIPWKPFRPGVDIHRLYGDGASGPTAALLKFNASTKVPLHTHAGYEHILVLAGSQRDQNGTLEAGTLAIHPPGTSHSVVSGPGCIVLAIYERPVRFTAATNTPPPTARPE
ncbi:MAG: cupin domain-containing protein [Limisphaerales bacterium]